MSFVLCSRLREYETNLDGFMRRGPEVEQIYFVILEMSRKYLQSSMSTFITFHRLSCFNESCMF